MLEYDFEASVGYWITLTSHDYQQRLNERLAPYGITFRQFQVLAWLIYQGPMSHAQLADRLMVERPTLTGILDRMEREGWIRRQTDPRDGRSKRVMLQPAVRAVWDQIVECLQVLRDEATQGMTPHEVSALKALLGRVRQNLGRWSVPGEPVLADCQRQAGS